VTYSVANIRKREGGTNKKEYEIAGGVGSVGQGERVTVRTEKEKNPRIGRKKRGLKGKQKRRSSKGALNG